MYDSGSVTISIFELPLVADQLDTIAEHDLQDADHVQTYDEDVLADAVQKIRKARVLLLEVSDLLGVPHVSDDDA